MTKLYVYNMENLCGATCGDFSFLEMTNCMGKLMRNKSH
ncbi:hypothetical protein NU08_2527 [Flavobacterium anhuiense]|uniref:Uncharacterized protein n=1 Tax=Flavobacterium anhuiense TaxID=459526 RepID=A0A444VY59_9FLAO|nr:hypothetical protein NU08_2527 [Flavobacterium anhuiense]